MNGYKFAFVEFYAPCEYNFIDTSTFLIKFSEVNIRILHSVLIIAHAVIIGFLDMVAKPSHISF